MFHLQTKNVAKALTTYVVSASISDTSIQNLADPVVITLQHVEGNRVTHPFSSQNKKDSEPLPDSPVKNNWLLGTSLVVKWLRRHSPNAGGPGSIPGQGARSHMRAATKSPCATNKTLCRQINI